MLAQNTAFAFFASLFSEMFFLAELKPDRAACRNSFRGLKRNDVDDDDDEDEDDGGVEFVGFSDAFEDELFCVADGA